MTWDIPVSTYKVMLTDGTAVWLPSTDIVRVGIGSGKGPRSKKMEPANDWLSVRGLPEAATSKEIARAIESALDEDS